MRTALPQYFTKDPVPGCTGTDMPVKIDTTAMILRAQDSNISENHILQWLISLYHPAPPPKVWLTVVLFAAYFLSHSISKGNQWEGGN